MTPERWRRVEEIYQAALDREPGRRDAFLRDVCGGDVALRGEVESLLAREGTTLDRPVSDGIASPAETVSPLNNTDQFGPYKIVAPIGAGGMGQVFRAVDTRLGRQVAIKTLREQFSARFEREAKAISSLNHPHICTLYDIGPNYLVMEMVEGESLATRLQRGKLSANETLEYGGQIAAALAAAHAKGVIHRDLKPGNIMLGKTGVKVLDFGLAKAPADETMTEAGAVLGTPAYMAPEQREGRQCDARSDIYSLGLVIYEMASGKRLAHGQAVQFDGLPQFAHVVGRCLEAEPDERWQAASDVRRELEWAAKSQQARSPAAPTGRLRGAWIAVALALAGAVGAGVYWSTRAVREASGDLLAGAQFTRLTDFEGSETDVTISRDGKFVAFRSDRDGPVDTWISQVGSGRFLNLTHGTQNQVLVRNVGFAPDGSEVWLSGVIGGTRLRLLPTSGGPARAFLSEHAMSLAWSPDGSQIVFHTYDTGDPVFIADRDGANARQIFTLGPGGHNHFLTWSRDGEWIYFVSGIWDAREMDVYRIRPDGGEPQRLTDVNRDVRFLAPLDDGALVYTSPDEDGSGPWLWSLDPERRLARRVSFGLERYTSVDASADGRRLVASVANPTASLWTIPLSDRLAGEADIMPFPVPTVRAFAPRYGGTSLFYLSSQGGGDGVWRLDGDQSTEIWRGVDGPLLEPPAGSADGTRIAIILRKQGKRSLYTLSSEGGDLHQLDASLDVSSAVCWSPDGKWIAAAGSDGHGAGLFKISTEEGKSVRLTTGPAANPVWSPDGTLIVYTGPVVGITGSLLMVRADGDRVEVPPVQVRVGGERYRFLPGSQRLVYMVGAQSSKQTFWLLDLATHQTRQLSDFDMPDTRTFDITPDGKHIVFDRLRDNSDVVLIDLRNAL